MKSRPVFIFAALYISMAFYLSNGIPCFGMASSEAILTETSQKPEIDGTISEAEYPLLIELKNGKIGFSRNDGSISFAISFKTRGWVACGFGTGGMDKSRMVLGCVKQGKLDLVEQIGVRHTHADSDNPLLVKYAGTEKEAWTTIEGELLLFSIIEPSATILPVIIAHGGDDRFTSIHSYKTAINLILR